MLFLSASLALRIEHYFLEFSGADLKIISECICKIVGVGISASSRYFVYPKVVFEQKLLCKAHSKHYKITREGLSRVLLEALQKPHVAHMSKLGKVINIYFFVEMLIHILNDCQNTLGIALGRYVELSHMNVILHYNMLDIMGMELSSVGKVENTVKVLDKSPYVLFGNAQSSCLEAAVIGVGRVCVECKLVEGDRRYYFSLKGDIHRKICYFVFLNDDLLSAYIAAKGACRYYQKDLPRAFARLHFKIASVGKGIIKYLLYLHSFSPL